ncbi:MAG: exodeoxyribonuclease V subunit gamma [Acidimicrobiales bacterium]|nr:exodeoxyribonuclease V subunit gamma [Acidimicrobiales bacterium]
MTVKIISGQRSEDLLGYLVDWLRDIPDDEFEADHVIVPNMGIREWLRSELPAHLGCSAAGGDGVVANVDFVFTDWLNGVARSHGEDDLDARWNLDRLPWAVLRVLNQTPDLLPGSTPPDQQLSRARHVADLFDRYVAHRPEMVRAWLTSDGAGDHDGTEEKAPLADEHHWQPELFRAVRAEIGAPSWAELLPDLPDRLAEQAAKGSLPRRIAIFGLGTITPTQAEVIAALGHHLDVLLLARLSSGSTAGRHPLTRAWGGSIGPTVALLDSLGDVERLEPIPDNDPSLLARVQTAIDLDLERPASPESFGPVGDGTIQVHACHGATRQVEALRDALLHLVAADPTLTARDVLVVCPDLPRFAPIIQPVLAEVLERPGMPVALADRSLARLTPVAAAVDALFRFSSGRSDVGDLLALLGQPAVAAASGLAGHLEVLDRWFEELNVRWGLDAGHRTRWGYPDDLDQGTWSTAVDRLLAGVLVPAPEPVLVVGDLVPHDDVGEIEVAGLLARFIDRLRWFTSMCAERRPLDEWCDVVAELADGLIAVDESDGGQVRDLRRLLDDLRLDVPTAYGVSISARDMGVLLTARLGTQANATRLRTGRVTVASPQPLRGVPARVVAIVGFDDQAVRAPAADGDDILVLRPRAGERDRLLDHRRELLDLVMAAREHLIITYDGRDVISGQVVPRTGHLVRLLDAVRAEAEATGGGHLPLVVQHSRHLADGDNLQPGVGEASRLVDDRPWTHDPNAARILQAMHRSEADARAASWAVPALVGDQIALDQLVNGVGFPSRTLLRDRLGISIPGDDEAPSTEVDLWPSGLALWGLGDDLLLRRLSGGTTDAWRDHHRRLGGLPPGDLGESALDVVEAEVDLLLGRADLRLPLPTDHRSVEVAVDGTVIRATVPVDSDQLPHLRFTRWHPYLRVAPWLHLAVATLAEPDVDWTAVLAARAELNKKTGPVAFHLHLRAVDGDRRPSATRILEASLDLNRRARSEAIPFFRRYSWSLLSGRSASAIREDLESDIQDHWTNWLHGDVDATLLEGDVDPDHPADVGLPAGGFRAHRYARLLHDTWTATVEESTPPTDDAESGR